MTSPLDSGGPPAALRLTLLIPFVVLFAILGARIQVNIATGGQGAVRLVFLLVPIAAMLTIIRYGSVRSLGFLTRPVFVLGVLPYLVLTALLPILGVMFHQYPERTLLSSFEATTALGFLTLGAAIASEPRSWGPALLLAIVTQLAYAGGQALYLLGGFGAELFAPFHQWDLSLYRELVQSRSSGLYLNPNELGLWAAIAVILSWTLLTARLRTMAITLAILTLLLSQSRGAAVALMVALVIGATQSILRRRIHASSIKTVLTFVVAALLATAVAIAVTPAGALDRFGALFDVLSEGPQADPNLAGRIDLWRAVTVLNSVFPFGTWGSPELVLGTPIDSSWFRALAQGSVPYLAALGLLTFASLVVGPSRYRDATVLTGVLVAIAGITQTPFGYPVIVLFWALLGSAIQAAPAFRRHRPSIDAVVPSGVRTTIAAPRARQSS